MLSRQEMLDRAVKGLRSQGWERCIAPSGACHYFLNDKRCAWGWVDPEGTYRGGNVPVGDLYTIRREGIGLAADLPAADVDFAYELQRCHDDRGNITPDMVEARFHSFTLHNGLKWPLDEGYENG